MKYRLLVLLILCISTGIAQQSVVLPDGHSLLISNQIVDKQGKYLYTAEGHKCIMWDINSGVQLFTFNYQNGNEPVGLDISPDGTKLALAVEHKLMVFNTVNGSKIFESKAENGYSWVSDVVFSDNGDYLFSTASGIELFETKTYKRIKSAKSSLDYRPRLFKTNNNNIALVTSSGVELYNQDNLSLVTSFKYNDSRGYQLFGFLRRQNLLVASINYSPVAFIDIMTGKTVGTIPGDFYDPAIIPSANTNEILLSGKQNKEGFLNLDLYDTENFKLKKSFPNTSPVKYHAASSGFFDGIKKEVYLTAYSQAIRYNLTKSDITNEYKGQAASLGMDIFNSFDYNYSNGYLHLTTDDKNVKTIDMFRMVPKHHTDLEESPEALAFSPTGDTLAVFTEKKVTIKNVVSGKIIKSLPTGSPETLNLDMFFFSNDGKSVYYLSQSAENSGLNRINLATGITSPALKIRSLGKTTLNPEKSLLAAFEQGYQYNHATIWNLASGKKIFDKEIPNPIEFEAQHIAISKDKKKVIIVQDDKFMIANVNDGSVLVEKKLKFSLDKFGCTASNNDLSLFLAGQNNGYLTAYDANGNILYEFLAHKSKIRRIVFSPDDVVFFTISYDNTIKVWESKTGKNLGTLYLFKDSNDFVFMDPAGRFDGTPEAMKKLYYLNGREIILIDKVFEKYYTPNLFQRILAKEQFPPIDEIVIHPLPLVRIIYDETTTTSDNGITEFRNTTGNAEITVAAVAPDDKVDEIRLFHNDKIVSLTSRGLFVTDNDGSDSKKYIVNLLPGINRFKALAINAQRTESEPAEIRIIYNGSSNSNQIPINQPITDNIEKVDKSATLHLIVVGINNYTNPVMNLNYAIADATAFRDEIGKDAKTVLSEVKTYFVTDGLASKKGIEEAFKSVQKESKPQDVLIFYYAGHGVIGKDKEFYLVPVDVSNLHNVQEELNTKGFPSKLIQQFAIDIKAQKQLFVLDACQSAGAFESILSADGDKQKSVAVVARTTGTHWIAASGAQQFATEFSQLGHGTFTYVMLKALQGSAANNKMITVNNLKQYVQNEVPEIIKKFSGTVQYPASYGFGKDFPVEILK